jgi:hypothetical protein
MTTTAASMVVLGAVLYVMEGKKRKKVAIDFLKIG